MQETMELKEGIDFFIFNSNFTKNNPEKIKKIVNENKLILVQLTTKHEIEIFLFPNWYNRLYYCFLSKKSIKKIKLNKIGLFPSKNIFTYSSQLDHDEFRRNILKILNNSNHPYNPYKLKYSNTL